MFQPTSGDPRVRFVLQQQNPGATMQPGLPIQPQSTQLQPNIPQQQQLGASQNTNQASPLLAQQLAGRPPVPGQHPPGMIQGQAGPMMQQRPQLLQDQQVRTQLQTGQQTIAQSTAGPAQAATHTLTSSAGGDGPSVSSEDLDNLDKDVGHELGDLGMGDGDFLDMGDDFNIFEFTDALDDLDDMPGDDAKATSTNTTSAASGGDNSAINSNSSSAATSTVSTSSSIMSSSTTTSVPSSTSVPIASATTANNSNVVTSSAGNAGVMNAAGRLVSQPPPYTASGSVTVPLRGVLPQGTVAGVMPGAPTTIIRGPPPPYPGPGLAPNAGGPSSIQTSKVRNVEVIELQ